jgi:hypothetical protein
LEYFLDDLQDYELALIIENIPYADRTFWEVGRFIAHANIQKETRKSIKPTSILKLPWDIDIEKTKISNEEIERLKRQSEQIYQSIILDNGK